MVDTQQDDLKKNAPAQKEKNVITISPKSVMENTKKTVNIFDKTVIPQGMRGGGEFLW